MKKAIIFTIAVSLMILSGCSLGTNGNVQNERIVELEQQLSDLQNKINQREGVSEQEESTPSDEEDADSCDAGEFMMFDGKCYEPGENVPETDCIVSETGGCESLDVAEEESSFIQILNPENNAILYEEPFYVTGETSKNCSKIVATAKNEEYKIDDVYILQNYKRGNSTFKYGIKHEWDNLDIGKNTYTFTAHCDGGNREATINLFFEAGGGVEMGKPVVYLYPEEKQEVFVLPKPEGGVTISEPALGDGWNVTAYPSGKIVDESGVVWPYLFWEGYSNLETPKEGFLAHQNELNEFFNEKLAYLGLITNEIEDFKEYWLEQLNEEKYYFISFISQAELDKHAPILVEPSPDTVIRVFFDYKVSDNPFTFAEQKLEKGPKRNGFTMTEWGGRLY